MPRKYWYGTILHVLAALVARTPARLPESWKVRVALHEMSHWVTLGSLLLQFQPMPWYARLLNGLSSLVLVQPLWQARGIAQSLPGYVAAAFGVQPARHLPAAFSWRRLVVGNRVRKWPYERIAYGTHTRHTLDLYRPVRQRTGAPLVVVVHGGAWETGDSQQLPELNADLAARGFPVAAINYRLAPGDPFPAAYDDLLLAITFLQHTELGINAGRIVLVGRSAGGHLVLLAAYRAPNPAIAGVVAFYPPTDMYYGYANPAHRMVIDTRGVLERFLGGSPDSASDHYNLSSPIQYVGQHTPATLLIHGDSDDLVRVQNSQQLAHALAAARRPHYFLRLPWATHGCDVNLSGPAGQLAHYAILTLLEATCE